MHILQSFCIAVFLPLFGHNKTPKVFCLTFGVHVSLRLGRSSFLGRVEENLLLRKEALLDELFCDLDCVGCCTLAEVVSNAPEVETRLH